ncbi:conserved hypothetical protein [Pyrobaculum islandicum DSM 4184]|uniref:Adhesin domain-containing protein n=1 Tax=Pyrobaculum islandicum (strain DSM 4184 / JCM 9189 / GEO3) TaxID=384616 RepID=A1RQJ2_PYRIL|nr:hypothetical protein [Pyrobaculum islandicum]ABL87224.1 conserved hypothetical protein [Pyrobaculum islandicum DSM 4184]
MRCFCGRPARESGFCPYHDPNCVKDLACRRKLVFTADCERCHLPGGEVSDVAPRLREARVHGPLFIYYVTGDVDLRGAGGIDLFIYSVRGNIYLEGARFRHIYIDQVVGDVDFRGGRAELFAVFSVRGEISAAGAKIGGHLQVVESSGRLDLTGAGVVGEIIVERFRGGVVARAGAYSITICGSRGDVDLSGARTTGDIVLVESEGGRLDLSGVEVGGRVFILASKFGGVRIDRPEVVRKIVVL